MLKQQRELEEGRQELQRKNEEYQKNLERLRDAQRKLERDNEAMQRQFDKMKEVHVAEVSRGTLKIEAVMMPLCCAGGGSVFCLMTLQQCLCLRMFALEAPTRVLKSEFKKLLANIDWQTLLHRSQVIFPGLYRETR